MLRLRNIEKLYERISELLVSKPLVLIAIDGSCASGKTTLANDLQELYDCNVFHMDDFFLRPEQRTPERFREVGGNVDYERFHDEVLLPLLNRESFSYRAWDCNRQALSEPVHVPQMRLNIIEGTYSMHPKLAFAYDLSVLLQVSPEQQYNRIMQRDERLHGRFFQEWMPMEQQYFTESRLLLRSDIILSEQIIQESARL